MKQFFITLLAVIIYLNVSALTSDSIKVSKVKAEFSGFFRADYWLDSRQVVDAVDGLFLLYPKGPDYDYNGKDINAEPNVNFLAMATRLRTNIKMPDLFKAKSSILVEVDFTGLSTSGTSTIVALRLRHAYTKLQWEKSSLLFGLTWHPLFVQDVFPSVASLNTGAPFQSFNRSPQITFQQKLVDGLTLSLSAINQSDSKSSGPIADPGQYSSTYIRNGLVPNLNTTLQLVSGPITIGGAFDFKSLRPRQFVTSIDYPDRKYITTERINSYTYMLYAKYQASKLTIKAKGMLGQNLFEHLMFGGYAVKTLDSLSGKETYTPTNHFFLFGNITYGKEFQVGLFVGYAKNLGTNDNFASPKERIYARGMDIAYLYRISPVLTYVNDRFQISTELEYTAAAYGKINNLDKGKVTNTKISDNYRFLVVVQYSF